MRILVVDDEPWVLDVIVMVLKADGHTIVSAKDGVEALERFQEQDFDLIMTDRSMPKGDGVTFAKAVKSQKPAQKIVVMSGAVGESDPCFDYVLNKPVRLPALSELIQQIAKTV